MTRPRDLLAPVARWLALIALLLLAAPASASPAQAPANDDLADAVEIDALPFQETQDISGATSEAAEVPSSCSVEAEERGVWYRLHAREAAIIALDTRGSQMLGGGQMDTVLSVWSDAPSHPLAEVACNDDGSLGELTSRLTLRLDADDVVLVKVSTLQRRPGTMQLRVEDAGGLRPANDDLADATAIENLPFTNVQDLTFATFEEAEAVSACQFWPEENGVWYRLDPTLGTVVLDTQDSRDLEGRSLDTVLSVWQGGSEHPLAEVVCSDEAAEGSGWSRVVVDLDPDADTFVKVSGVAGAVGWARLNARSSAAPPANDDLAVPVHVGALPFSHELDTTGATDQAGETRSACASDGGLERGAWFRYEATDDVRVVFAARATAFTPVVSVWSDGAAHPLSELACSAERVGYDPVFVAVDVAAGSAVFVKLGGLASQGGPATFFAAEAAPEPGNDALADAIRIEALPFSDRRNVTGATDEADEARSSCAIVPGPERGLWYRYRATEDVKLWIEARSGGAAGDIAGTVSAWSAGPGHPLAEIDCEVAPRPLRLDVPADTEVLLKLGPALDQPGAVRIRVEEAPPPPTNDDVANAVPIDSDPFQVVVDGRTATEESGEVRSRCLIDPDEPEGSVWYRFTSATPVGLWLDTEGSMGVPVLSVWRGGPDHPLTEVTCSSRLLAGEPPRLLLAAEPGVDYYIKVSGDAGRSDVVALGAVLAPPPPPNDNLAAAIPVATVPFTGTVDLTSATRETSELPPSCAPDPSPQGGTAWYAVRQEAWSGASHLVFESRGSGFPTVLSAWQGGPSHPLSEVGCMLEGSGAPARLPMLPGLGDPIYVKVESASNDASGEATLSVRPGAFALFLPSLER